MLHRITYRWASYPSGKDSWRWGCLAVCRCGWESDAIGSGVDDHDKEVIKHFRQSGLIEIGAVRVR